MTLHEFQLVLDPWLDDAAAGRYDDVRANPPEGCSVRDVSSEPGRVYLECVREAPTRLEAIAQVVAEIRGEYGLPDADDLGIEKLWEFIPEPEFSHDLIAQLTLMAVRRAEFVGLGAEDVIAFLRAATT